MDDKLIPRRKDDQGGHSLDDEWRRMNAALTKLGRRETLSAPVANHALVKRGRLIVGLDLTGSREASLKQARVATAAMFDAIRTLGAIDVQLVYFRGNDECRASKWHHDPGVLCEAMRKLSCGAGFTQIARMLRLALADKEKISGFVFVGDHCEDNPDELIGLAKEFGKRSIPLFIFHECADNNPESHRAAPVFKAMAKASGGIYVEFEPDSGNVLREMLSSVAAFSAAGAEGVKQVEAPRTHEARQLKARLMLGPGDEISKEKYQGDKNV